MPSLPGVETAPLPQDPPVFAGRASVLGYYNSRPATMADVERVEALLDEGHRAFAELGIDEGRYKKYPSSRRLTRSVKVFHICGGECPRPDDRRVRRVLRGG